MTGIFGIIGLNAIFMFIGAFYYWARVTSIYCTMCACMVQFIGLIVVAPLLFTKFNEVCARSLYYTFAPFIWHYGDDIFMTTALWVMGWFAMFIWLACGLCSAMEARK